MSISAYNSFFFVLSANKALVLSNLGRLKLLFAQAVRRRKRQELSAEERRYFNQELSAEERRYFNQVIRYLHLHLLIDNAFASSQYKLNYNIRNTIIELTKKKTLVKYM